MHILLATFLAGLLWDSSTCCFVLLWNSVHTPTPTKDMLATIIEMFSNTNSNSDSNSGIKHQHCAPFLAEARLI
mgnify:FL=1